MLLTLEWIIWSFLTISTILLSWGYYDKVIRRRLSFNKAIPPIIVFSWFLIIVFYISDLSKIHILWFFPIGIFFIISYINLKAFRLVKGVMLNNRNKEWEDGIILFASLYKNYRNKFSDEEAFVKTLEFGYKPLKLKNLLDVMTDEEKHSVPTSETLRNSVIKKVGEDGLEKINRYLSILLNIGLSGLISKYLDDMRVLDFPTDLDVYKEISDRDKFTFNEKDFSLQEVLYCFSVIEFPQIVTSFGKEEFLKKINVILENSEDSINSALKDPIVLQHMKDVESM